MTAASHSSNSEVVQALLDARADIRARDSEGLDSLMFAAVANGHSEIIEVLVSAGADVNATTMIRMPLQL